MPVIDATAWTAMLLGLFAIFAAVGSLRKPGIWQTLIKEVEASPALQMISGVAELAAGAAIYLVNPWVPSDLLAIAMRVIGGIMMLEALVVVGFSDIYFHFWLRNLAVFHRGWAVVSLAVGVVLTVAGALHLNTVS
ncbi:hypothetical protein [Croceicoccus bisphenolivorans]|uniref:hypothetical protein n=1 Tax=Croceicoccus bisphenolivorans TaxID=1783232 RepID=UPI00082ED1A5|nr:hypothetical protein [Croceicoccus bisphenolivorans]